MEKPDCEPLSTFFALAGRAQPSDLQKEIAACLDSPVARVVLDSLDGLVMVLNQHRQVLAGNAELLQALAQEGEPGPLGRRPGEILGCVHVAEGPDGCGTSKACSQCGAALAILATQAGENGSAVGECLLSMRKHGEWQAGEFHVQARSIDLAGHPCVVLVLHDISAQKRKEAMEGLFFHDVLNLLQGLRGWSETLQEQIGDPRRAAEKIVRLSERITHQVMQQRIIQLAEHGQLQVRVRKIGASGILEELGEACRHHGSSNGRQFGVEPPEGDPQLETDPDLLLRVLLNMGVNALEAVPDNGRVAAGFRVETGLPTFFVWNEGSIPETIALSIFQRSFSTKGDKGRGLGTYAMKLLGENHLGGRVGFRSSREEGTTFFLHLPHRILTFA
jgi:hypothetical protein